MRSLREASAAPSANPDRNQILPHTHFSSNRPRNTRSLRISLIPLAVTASDFRSFLERLQPHNGSDLGRCGNNILAMSLVQHGRSQVATICFDSEPDFFSVCTSDAPMHLNFRHHETDYQLVVDCDFFGLTPLYSSEEPTVEWVYLS
jgi:hypothetical protein